MLPEIVEKHDKSCPKLSGKFQRHVMLMADGAYYENTRKNLHQAWADELLFQIEN